MVELFHFEPHANFHWIEQCRPFPAAFNASVVYDFLSPSWFVRVFALLSVVHAEIFTVVESTRTQKNA